MQETSAGILVYRIDKRGTLQVLLGKNGGPRYENRHVGTWNIPKGHVEEGEDLCTAAIREFVEETSLQLPSDINPINLLYLGTAYTSGKRKCVHIYAIKHDYNVNGNHIEIKSNLCETEWPPHSGNIIEVPELCDAYYFDIDTAKNLIFPYQKIFIERLLEQITN